MGLNDDEIRCWDGDGKEQYMEDVARFDSWEKCRKEKRFPNGLIEFLSSDRGCGFPAPTSIQSFAWPALLQGQDVVGIAKTGSGKTLAFLLPAFMWMKKNKKSANPVDYNVGPAVLVLTPTRELCFQIFSDAQKFGEPVQITAACCYGGAPKRDQEWELQKGPMCLIATPGRLNDFAKSSTVKFDMVHYVTLDEADRMLDMGFEPQVRQIVEKLGMGKNSRFPRQSMMFSATFAKEVQLMAQDFLNDYVFITVGRVGSASEDVSQKVVFAQDVTQKVHQLEKAIKEYLPKDGLAVVFVETKKSADELEMKLYDSGVAVTAIHGDRSQDQREEALQAFKSGANPVLVATDVAARGLDIPNVSLVVNFDMPKQLDDYVHRIGRTGRAGRKGTAVALVNERCYYLSDLHHLLTEAKQDVPEWFGDLCNKSRSFGGKARGRGENRFGGQDLRLESGPRGLGDSQAKASVNAIPTPMRGSPGATRAPGSWGNTGAEDAW
mmetsp:Transcript_103214/g.179062  ORF Transcript_103214/g.179062 Transcript_103214/m.179062 type:complete len:494 (+) Transcript_103214:86-1567(+)